MNMSSQPSNQTRLNRNGIAITVILLIVSIPSAFTFAYFGFINNLTGLYLPATTLTLGILNAYFALSLIQKERTNVAMLMVGGVFIVNVSVAMIVVQGLGILIAISTVLVLFAIVGLAMTSNYSTPGV